MRNVEATSPYRWPYDGGLDASRLALLVCGSDAGWARRTPLDTAAEANLERLRSTARALGIGAHLIVHDAPAARRPLVGLPEIGSPPLVVNEGDIVVHAAGIDGFYGSSLDPVLRRSGRDLLLLVGRGIETTVHSTLRSANDAGYECLTIADACSAIDDTLRPAAISSIEMSGGIFGAVATTDAVVTALRSLARGSEPFSHSPEVAP